MQGFPQPTVPGEAVSHLMFAPLPSAAFWARRYTEAVLRAWQLQIDDIETAQLCVSELVTNSVKFTGSPAPQVDYSILTEVKAVSLILRHRSEILIIEVSDPDSTPPALTEAGPSAESGRGLMLVRAVSKEWNFYPPSSGGKVVYCVISARRKPGNDPAD